MATHSAANLYNEKLSNNISDKIKMFHKGYVNRQSIPIDQSYDQIENFGNKSIYGSVHLYRLRDLPVLEEKFGKANRSFKVYNLVRNPIDLVWSGFGQFKELFKSDINELHWTLGKVLEDKDFIYHICSKYNLQPGEIENLSFFGAARVLGSLRLDLDALNYVKNESQFLYSGEIKMEEVTTKPEKLKELLLDISDSTIDVNQNLLSKIYDIGKINKHKKDDKDYSGKVRYENLLDWQKEVLLFYLEKYNITEPYEKLGYDLSFLKEATYE